MTAKELAKLIPGDIVGNLGSGRAYIILEIVPVVVAARTQIISNPSEWAKIDKSLDQIKAAREALGAARNIECNCTSFQRQHEGCTCAGGNKVKAAEKHLWGLVKDID